MSLTENKDEAILIGIVVVLGLILVGLDFGLTLRGLGRPRNGSHGPILAALPAMANGHCIVCVCVCV